MRKAKSAFVYSGLVFVALGCAVVEEPPEPFPDNGQGIDVRKAGPKLGKADRLTGQCAATEPACGGISNGNCWCDQWCSLYGDCCSDTAETCDIDECLTDGTGCPTGQQCQVSADEAEPNNCIDELAIESCGGFLGLSCPAGKWCVDNPTDDCDPNSGGSDCAGLCLSPVLLECGRDTDQSCPDGLNCVEIPTPQCDPAEAECPGVCLAGPKVKCGGFLGQSCPHDKACIDVPVDDCDPLHGGSDCGGLCVAPSLIECGGFLGISCPESLHCVDLPGDDCDPYQGGSDCPGLCINR